MDLSGDLQQHPGTSSYCILKSLKHIRESSTSKCLVLSGRPRPGTTPRESS